MGIGSQQGGHKTEATAGAVAVDSPRRNPRAHELIAGGAISVGRGGTPMPRMIFISRFPTHPTDGQAGLTDRVDRLLPRLQAGVPH